LTPHNEANQGDYAESVLLPGDPQRAEWIAETFLDNARCVNRIRGALGFTGSYRGRPVSVQATGIGRPSFTIYVHELLAFYGARTVIRIGSCGALHERVGMRSLVLAERACMDYEIYDEAAWQRPEPTLFHAAVMRAGADGVPHQACPMVCSDTFYHPDPFGRFGQAKELGALACDMETSAVLALARQFGARGLSICTVVDSLATGEETHRSERQALFGPMAKLALDVVADLG